MKRSIFTLFVALVFLVPQFVQTNELDPDNVLLIPKVENGTITLDGEMNEEVWAEVLTSELSDSTTIDDYYALFGVLYDEVNLYMYFKITDDWLDFKKNDWNTDAVEIYVDGDDSKMDTWDNIDDFQVTVPLGAETVEEWAGVGPTEPYPRDNIQFGTIETDDGWATEVALPIEDFQFTDFIGFDIALNDADETEVREDQIWFLGDGAWNQPSSWGVAHLTGVMVKVEKAVQSPTDFQLQQNFPNPFNPLTWIEFSLDKQSHTELTVFNTLGDKVATLTDKSMQAGAYRVQFDGTNLPSGIYYYRLETDTQSVMKKMILIK